MERVLGRIWVPWPASRAGGLCKAWAQASSLFGTVGSWVFPGKLHFPVSVGPFGLWDAGDGRAGQRFLEPSLLYRVHTLQNSRVANFFESAPKQVER